MLHARRDRKLLVEGLHYPGEGVRLVHDLIGRFPGVVVEDEARLVAGFADQKWRSVLHWGLVFKKKFLFKRAYTQS